MILLFVAGYALIATEHIVKVNKSASALLLCGVLWVIYMFAAPDLIPLVSGDAFRAFLSEHPELAGASYAQQCVKFVVEGQILGSLGETAEVLVFLIGAMTIVDLIDMHGGFNFITKRITTSDKHKLLWIISGITFFLSALLDNMTTTIIMVMLLRKLVANYKERWVFASIIVIAANSGGAWSPIGDVTTIMLWIKGNISSLPIIKNLILPCLVSLVIPLLFASRILHGIITAPGYVGEQGERPRYITRRESRTIFFLGVAMLLFVPVFKSVTHLPPFMGIMLALGVLWVYTELMYSRKRNIEESIKNRVSKVLKHIDMPTILFFLGILLSVSALQSAGILGSFSAMLDEKVHNVYVINIMIGVLSSVIDNVPLVAGAIGMYPAVDPGALATMADPAYMAHFVPDGHFWQMLAYCSGVGGSILIIGSAAGVVAMGLEKINFLWYTKNISLMALSGYLAGAGVYILQAMAGW